MKRSHWVACVVMITSAGCGAAIVQVASPAAAKTAAGFGPPPSKGVRVLVSLTDERRSDELNDRLHFCVFENGSDDLIYVGVKYGMWSRASFVLQRGSEVAYTGHIDALPYGGVLLSMGDVMPVVPDYGSLHITRVTGFLK